MRYQQAYQASAKVIEISSKLFDRVTRVMDNQRRVRAMRISTNMIFNAGVSGINEQTARPLKLQQQVATGRRILDAGGRSGRCGAGARRSSRPRMSISQYGTNLSNAKSALGLEEAQLATLSPTCSAASRN